MSSWETTLKDVNNSLGCIYHLIKEEHSDVVDPVNQVTINMKTVSGGDSKSQKTLNDVSNILQASRLLDRDSVWDCATSSNAALENQPTIRIVRRVVIPSWLNSLQTGDPIGDLEGKMIDPESLHQLLQRNFISPLSVSQSHIQHDIGNLSSIPPHSPIPHYFEPPQANDPFLFHTNAYDSPPPSPGHEAADYEYNMRRDPNGAIPDFIDVGVQGNNNSDTEEHKYCHLPLCDSFHHLLQTTPGNVADKQNILKELLHHSESLMRKVIEDGPVEMKEHFTELVASIVLINNSLQRSTDYQSYLANSKVVQSLVVKVKGAIQNFM